MVRFVVFAGVGVVNRLVVVTLVVERAVIIFCTHPYRAIFKYSFVSGLEWHAFEFAFGTTVPQRKYEVVVLQLSL